jgi:hypothetical protein
MLRVVYALRQSEALLRRVERRRICTEMEKVTAREVEEKVREVAAEDLPEHVYARNAAPKCPTKGEFHA